MVITMECRIGCAACCIDISITSSIPGMPDGKPAGTRCVQLTVDNKCMLFGKPERPDICVNFSANNETCGKANDEAHKQLSMLEAETQPS